LPFLSSEIPESYFVLWRLTKNSKWRDYAWDYAESIHEYCRTENGYSNIGDATDENALKTDYQNAELLAATLKYLYLIFTDDQTLPLDQWVFNAYGQPLPICGHNVTYESCGSD